MKENERMRIIGAAVLTLGLLLPVLGCNQDAPTRVSTMDAGSTKLPATIVGSFSGDLRGPGKLGSECSDAVITIDGGPANIRFGDDCTFLVSEIAPSSTVVLGITLPRLGLSGTLTLRDVTEGELIEISVTTASDALVLSVTRRDRPEPTVSLPDVITRNNVTLMVGAGIWDRGLDVRGNNFTLIGRAGPDCDLGGWTVVSGSVLVKGNNATFRNISFEGPVEVHGNNTTLINCCLAGRLLDFGHNTEIGR